MTTDPDDNWKAVAAQARRQRDEKIRAWDALFASRASPKTANVRSIPVTSGELSPREIALTETLPSHLVEALATGQLKAEELLRAFIKRAIIAQHLTNPLTEIMFDWGLKRAQALDEQLRQTGKPVGPFHGLPISLKEIINVKGLDSTFGFVGRVGRPAASNATIVDVLSRGGAVFYCKTSVPQGLMSGECFNYLFGRTTSPFNTSNSAGGSSGGEGSLVSLGGSPIGVGSDMGGSINTPANHNGIYGLSPSTERLPLHGAQNTSSNLIVKAVGGPLSRSLDGLEVYVKGVLALEPWTMDATCIKMPWNQSEHDRIMHPQAKLCFGFVEHDGVVNPHPPIQRGMSETKAALKAAGHYVIEVPSFFDSRSDQLEKCLYDIFNAQGDTDIKSILEVYNEPVSPELIMPQPQDKLELPQYLVAANRILRLRQKYLDRYMSTASMTPTGRPVDVLILPSGGHVAPPHGTMGYLLYEALSNLLDWTCGTIPVGIVDQELDQCPADSELAPLSPEDTKNWEGCK